MTFVIQDNSLGWQPIASTSTVKNHPLGTIVRASDPTYGSGEFIYLEGCASTVAGSWVTYDPDAGGTVLLAANAIGQVGVAMSANVDAQYGWYQINGQASAVGSTVSIADSANLYATATGGTAGSTVVTGDRIWGAKSAEASSDGSVLVNIHRPFVNDAVNAGTS